jgi:hypothetical protein
MPETPDLHAVAGRLSMALGAAAKRGDGALMRAILREALWTMQDAGGSKAVARPRDGFRFAIRFDGHDRAALDPALARVDAEALWLATGHRVAVVDLWTGEDYVAFPDTYEGLGHA